ncbi:HlyD family secretion protein [Halomonas sp. GXIMD04776]|uniref:HlyD family secretion protein n=1 Tax=Halomonas sp. GXIMD04776 TaxID=3415605 RepID=UPI003CB78ABC
MGGSIGTYEGVVRGVLTPVGAQRDGRISDVLVEPGEKVSAGDVLARMHNQSETARVEQRRAELELARAAVEQKKLAIQEQTKTRRLAIEQNEARVKAAESTLDGRLAELERWRGERERSRQLAEGNNISQAQLEEVRAAEATALSESVAARADVAMAKSDLSTARAEFKALDSEQAGLQMLEARVVRAKAELSRAEAVLEATVLRAAADGWIVEWSIGPGGSVQAGDPVVVQWISDQIWVETYVDQDVLAQVESGQDVSVEFDAIPGETFPGKVQSMRIEQDTTDEDGTTSEVVSPLLPDNPRYAVRIGLTELPPETRLLPGLAANIDFDPDPAGGAKAVPVTQGAAEDGLLDLSEEAEAGETASNGATR